MGAFLSELGTRLAERWVTALALPGALYLAVATAAYALGWDRAWDVGHLVSEITRLAEDPRVDTFGGQALVFAAILAGSSAAGLLARGTGRIVERLWTAADWHRWPPPLRGWTRRWVESRRRRWDVLRGEVERVRAAGDGSGGGQGAEAAFAAAYDRMARLSPERPERPTWAGDRIGAARTRLDRDHDADLAVLWPHLWLVLPEEARTEVAEARDALSRSTGLAAWALLYLPMAVWWYPAALASAVLAAIAWVRTRAAAEAYAALVEASVRLYATDLADRAGVGHGGRFDRDLGERLTLRLRASMPPPPPVPAPAAPAAPSGSPAAAPERPAR
ncbi:hypothetical protein ABZ234_09880 [Nocardiopsis sp. NPDC006198]|uniref:hypothetical protein n=1 Tax=Nocardiopsis sp. NPDC006198 TaxID=3154472 RepID=UPI0033AF9162